MLTSLSIRNFVLIEDASLEFGPGLTVLSGETGAGKTLLTHALGLLMGERAEEGLVGLASDEAVIQAVFDLDETDVSGIPEDLRTLAGICAGETIVTRRLTRQGRNRSYVNDTAVTLSTLEEVVGRLLSFAGQHEHRRLLDPAYQLAVLDLWAGEETMRTVVEYKGLFAEATETLGRLEETRRSRTARLQEIELLRFQVTELVEAALSVEEEESLAAEQKRLARAEETMRAAGTAADLLSSEGDAADAARLVAQAASQLGAVQGVEETLDAAGAGLVEMQYRIAELSRELHGFVDRIVIDPGRLQEVDERLRLYSEVARKYGGSTRSAVLYGTEAAERLALLEQTEEDLGRLEEDASKHVASAVEAAKRLGELRRQAAPRLEQAIGLQLADLGMVDARVQVAVEPRGAGWESLRETGAEAAEFMLAANPGQPARSLARTASGGELSRVLLAIKCALAGAGERETLVFDEIDAGIGGRTAVAVAEKLRELAGRSQLVVVTHLAQVAAKADGHYVIDKETDAGSTVTKLTAVVGDGVVEELCRMMGGSPDDVEAMSHARDLRDRAREG